jgi:hypothetical protein
MVKLIAFSYSSFFSVRGLVIDCFQWFGLKILLHLSGVSVKRREMLALHFETSTLQLGKRSAVRHSQLKPPLF